VIRIRPFRNSDPPALVDLWRSLPPLRGRAQNISLALFERLVLDKPFFDRQGLLVAEEQGHPIGFVQAGFGSAEDGSKLDPRRGAIFAFSVARHDNEGAIALQLIAAAENYLQAAGAVEVVAGGASPDHPFYLGLYGGSELPGLLASDAMQLAIFTQAGYRERERRAIWQRSLPDFHAPMNRAQLLLRKTLDVTLVGDPPSKTWWEAGTYGQTERFRFELQTKASGESIGHATFWDVLPLGESWGVRTAGLIELEIAGQRRRQGLATFLLVGSFRLLVEQGFVRAEIQTGPARVDMPGLLAKLGCEMVEEGIVLAKKL
jgi:hypothetical protein